MKTLDVLKAAHAKVSLPPNTPLAAKKGSEATVYLYSEFGPEEYGGYSSKAFAADLAQLGDVSSLNLRINSIGGSVIEALGIYNTIKAHPARNKTVWVDGIAASAASFIAMAGTKVMMADTASLMVHRPWLQSAGGTSDELRATADLLDRNEAILVKIYQGKTGLPEKDISAMLAAETWLSAEEAVAKKFADGIFNTAAPQASAKPNSHVLSVTEKTTRFRHEADAAIADMEMYLLKHRT